MAGEHSAADSEAVSGCDEWDGERSETGVCNVGQLPASDVAGELDEAGGGGYAGQPGWDRDQEEEGLVGRE
jgi:hypothetical protein